MYQLLATFSSSVSFTTPGHYMYVDSVYAKHFQEVAKLTSPMTTVPMAGCLSFYYHRDQERGNIFSVFTRDQLGHFEEIWRPEVYATTGWTMVGIDIKAPHPLEVSAGASIHHYSETPSVKDRFRLFQVCLNTILSCHYVCGISLGCYSPCSVAQAHNTNEEPTTDLPAVVRPAQKSNNAAYCMES